MLETSNNTEHNRPKEFDMLYRSLQHNFQSLFELLIQPGNSENQHINQHVQKYILQYVDIFNYIFHASTIKIKLLKNSCSTDVLNATHFSLICEINKKLSSLNRLISNNSLSYLIEKNECEAVNCDFATD